MQEISPSGRLKIVLHIIVSQLSPWFSVVTWALGREVPFSSVTFRVNYGWLQGDVNLN
jgi:hypothetical protein